MPVKCSDKKGYCQWGNHGAKYTYVVGSQQSKTVARQKATRQGIAAHANGWHSSRGGSRKTSKKVRRTSRKTLRRTSRKTSRRTSKRISRKNRKMSRK